MKKAAAFAAAVILAVTATAYSESTEQPEQTSLQADEAQTAGNSQKKGKYFKPISGWVSVKGEGIYTGSDEYVFHLDSGEMSASLDAAVVPLNADDKQYRCGNGIARRGLERIEPCGKRYYIYNDGKRIV